MIINFFMSRYNFKAFIKHPFNYTKRWIAFKKDEKEMLKTLDECIMEIKKRVYKR